jgi:hypothetical protein
MEAERPMKSEFGIDYSGLPEGIQEGVQLYLERGFDMPGAFVEALMKNQLVESFGKADSDNHAAMFQIVSWLYNKCPHNARGEANFNKWVAAGGLAGMAKARETDGIQPNE